MVREACAMKGHPPLKRLPRGCLGLPTGDDWTLRTPISNPLIVDLCATDTQFSTPKVAQRSLDGRGLR